MIVEQPRLLDYLSPPEPRKSPEKKKSSGQKISKLKTQVKPYPIPKQSHFCAKHPKKQKSSGEKVVKLD